MGEADRGLAGCRQAGDHLRPTRLRESSRPTSGHDYDTYAADLSSLLSALDIHDVVLVGFSMGTGEVVRYISTYGSHRLAKAVFIGALQPFMLKTDENPSGVPQETVDGMLDTIKADRYAFFTGFLQNFYNTDENLGTRISEEALRNSWQLATNMSPYTSIWAVSTWFTDWRADIDKIDVPALIMHGTGDLNVPIDITSRVLAKMLPSADLRRDRGRPARHAVDARRGDQQGLAGLPGLSEHARLELCEGAASSQLGRATARRSAGTAR